MSFPEIGQARDPEKLDFLGFAIKSLKGSF